MDSNKVIEIEKIVDEMGDSFDLPNKSIVSKLNDLTGLNWSAEDYFNYCSEYWSHDSLQETVYALLNNGEYPEKNRVTIYCKRPDGPVNKKDIIDMIINEIRDLKYNPKDYSKFVDGNGSRITLDKDENDIYGFEQMVRISVTEESIVRIIFENINESLCEQVSEAFEKVGFTITS